AVSHSVLPGLVAGFLLGGSLDSPLLLAGAALPGVACDLVIEAVSRRRGVRGAAATGIVFSAVFALGVVGLGLVASRVDLDPDCVLFGSLETTIHGKRIGIGGVEVPAATASAAGAVALALAGLVVCGRGWGTLAFDPLHARC